MSIKLLIVTHGELGREIFSSTRDIMGKTGDVEVYSIYRDCSAEQIKNDIEELLNNLLKDSAVLVLTDMLGGTPTNMTLPFLRNENIEIITGVNLPMLITALNKKNEVNNVRKLSQIVNEAGIKSIVDCRSSAGY